MEMTAIDPILRFSQTGKREQNISRNMIGNAPISFGSTYNRKTQEIKVEYHHNPAIFIPDLMTVVLGCESWWGKIEKPEDLQQITDADINNVWYVKALKAMSEQTK